MIKIINEDLLTANVDAIAHQVNCMGVMGAGLAKQIRSRYVYVYDRYLRACELHHHSDLLGKVQTIKTVLPNEPYVINMFAQEFYGKDKRYTDYDALYTCLTKVKEFMLRNKLKTLGLPYGLGCGLAGGSWKIVYELIRDAFGDSDITIYICKKEVM